MHELSSIVHAIAAAVSPVWIAAGSAALLLIIGALALRRPSGEAIAPARRFPLVVFGAVLCGALIWAIFASATLRDQRTERLALERRAQQLTAQVLVPGSPLACLDALAGDLVETACEKVVFASPSSLAAAMTYIAAQFALLADMTAYTRYGGGGIDRAFNSLRGALEADPFGFLAAVLVMRYGCTSSDCPPLTLLRDPTHVRTNLIAQTLDHYIEQYRGAWAKLAGVGAAVAVAAPAEPSVPVRANAPLRGKVKLDIDFPTAESIPPISIMNPEPKAPAAPEGTRKPPSAAPTDPVWTPAPAQPK